MREAELLVLAMLSGCKRCRVAKINAEWFRKMLNDCQRCGVAEIYAESLKIMRSGKKRCIVARVRCRVTGKDA